MSLYALPGLLFPPLALKDPSPASCSRSVVSNAPVLSLEAMTEFDTGYQPNEPFHGADRGTRREDGTEGDGTQNCGSPIQVRPARGRIAPSPTPGVAVAVVKEARIDTARLIRSLTSSAAATAAMGGNRSNLAGRHASRADGSKPPARRTTTRPPSRSRSPDGEGPAVTPQEECMEFELTIHYGDGSGKSCSRIRRLECFLELRRALVQEQEEAEAEAEPTEDVMGDGVVARSSSAAPLASSVPSSRSSCRIPHVPRVQHGESGAGGGSAGGVAGRGGFLFLQALVRSYVPRLEEWLRSVLGELGVSNPERCPALWSFLFPENDGGGAASAAVAENDDAAAAAPTFASRATASSSSTMSPSQSSASFRPLDAIEESDEHEG